MKTHIFGTLFFIIFFSLDSICQIDQLTDNEFKYSLKDIWQNNKKQIARKKAIQLCLSNPNSPSSLLNLYYLRKRVSKEKLFNVLKSLDTCLISNEYAKSLKHYIDNKQVNKGDQYLDFIAQTSMGQDFILSDMINSQKDVLIIFGGLDCMGKETVRYFIDLYSRLDKEKVEIVNFLYCTDINQLAQSIRKSGMIWPGVSDFLGDHSLTKLKYNAQGRPTFVYIKSNGKILVNKEGPSLRSIRLLKRHIIDK